MFQDDDRDMQEFGEAMHVKYEMDDEGCPSEDGAGSGSACCGAVGGAAGINVLEDTYNVMAGGWRPSKVELCEKLAQYWSRDEVMAALMG